MRLSDAAHQAWPPFVLVTGLLLIGLVAYTDGLFERIGGSLERLPGGPAVLFSASALVVVVVTAVLNLDTAVVFLTPVVVIAARRRGIDEQPFLYAAVFMANASSLYLPGSNLTNLLVLSRDPVPGGTFAARLLAPALAVTITTAVGLWLLFRSKLREGSRTVAHTGVPRSGRRVGILAAVAAAVLTLSLPQPALPVLGVGLAAVGIEVVRGRLQLGAVVRAIGPGFLLGLLLASVALGVLARVWDGPAQLVAGAGRWEMAAIGALAAIVSTTCPRRCCSRPASADAVDRLEHRPEPRCDRLAVGVSLDPGARQIGASPSIKTFSCRGLVLAPVAILASLTAASVVSSPS